VGGCQYDERVTGNKSRKHHCTLGKADLRLSRQRFERGEDECCAYEQKSAQEKQQEHDSGQEKYKHHKQER